MELRAASTAPADVKGGARNRAIDVLRGLAVVLMICNHVGAASRVTMLVNLPVWLDPAGPFVLLAGLVLGMGLRGGKPVKKVWHRARQLWFIHMGCMLVVLAVHETTGRLVSPSIEAAGGLLAVAWKLPTLRLQARDYMNILPLFIVFLAAAPLLVLAMRRGLTLLCFVASLAMWLATQRAPGWFRFTDEACGPESFVLPAWQFAFVTALILGFHSDALPALYRRHRSWLLSAVVLVVSGIFILAQLQRPALARLDLRLAPEHVWMFSKETWAPGRAIYTLGMYGLGFLTLRWLELRQRTRGLAWLELMGQRSLYCFLVHLPFALLASGLDLASRPALVQELSAILTVLAVYMLARYRVLARYIPS